MIDFNCKFNYSLNILNDVVHTSVRSIHSNNSALFNMSDLANYHSSIVNSFVITRTNKKIKLKVINIIRQLKQQFRLLTL